MKATYCIVIRVQKVSWFPNLEIPQFPQRCPITLAVTMVRDWGAIADRISQRPVLPKSAKWPHHWNGTHTSNTTSPTLFGHTLELNNTSKISKKLFFHPGWRRFFHLWVISPNVWEDSRSKNFQCKYGQSFNVGWYLSPHWEVSSWIFIFWRVICQTLPSPKSCLFSKTGLKHRNSCQCCPKLHLWLSAPSGTLFFMISYQRTCYKVFLSSLQGHSSCSKLLQHHQCNPGQVL